MDKFEYYDDKEIMHILRAREKLLLVDTGLDEIIVRLDDLPDFIVDYNTKYGQTDLKIYDCNDIDGNPLATTYGEFLNKCEPKLRSQIIDRLVEVQQGAEIKDYLIIDVNQKNYVEELMLIARGNNGREER